MKKQQLTSIIKRARNIMRKDAGLSTDVDRTPQLSWMLFLKFFDDLEKRNEALISGHRSVIEKPHRWRDWASNDEGITGDDLIKYVNDKLIPYLRELKGTKENDPRDVLASLFAETYNRMLSGYLFREIINLIDEIDFQSKDDIFTLSHLYESMLKEMRDAAGSSGEFYTPRPVVRFIVEHIKPKLGEKVLDPACGTGGFLVEAYEYMKQQAKTAEDYDQLQYKTFFGIEKKPMPYLLGTMNLMLHGIETPNIQRRNTLTTPLKEITEKDKFDVILTNPPFGGEEEKGIQDNFPMSMRTAETTLLFMQYIMRLLKNGGRCGIVLPPGFLFGEGVAQKIKQALLDDFNLHSIIKLPKGVFSPYTDQETSLVFIEKQNKTKHIWYYDHPLPPDRQKLKNPCYIKSKPLLYEEFEPLNSWWGERVENEYAWKVTREAVGEDKFNLDLHHPKKTGGVVIRDINQLSEELNRSCDRLDSSVDGLAKSIRLISPILSKLDRYPLKTLEEMGVKINPENRNPAKESSKTEFQYVDISSVSLNTFENVKLILGSEAPSRARRVIREGDVVLSTVRPYLCGHAVVTEAFDNQICSTGFAVLRSDNQADPKFLYYMLISPQLINQYHLLMRGAHYPALNDRHIRKLQFPAPEYDEQHRIGELLDDILGDLERQKAMSISYAQQIIDNVEVSSQSVLATLVRSITK